MALNFGCNPCLHFPTFSIIVTVFHPQSDFSHLSCFTENTQLQEEKTATTMCQGNLQVSTSCGHHQKVHPLQHCKSYSHTRNRCDGTVSVLHTTTINAAPTLCVRCASRIEANIVRELDQITTELETNIAEINHGLWVERNRPFTYVALIFERARLREALKGFQEEMEEELVELRETHGMGRWDRVADLRG